MLYYDDSIKLGSIPKILQDNLDELKELYDKGDDGLFEGLSEYVNAQAKGLCQDGLITDDQLDLVFKMLGW